MDVSPIAKVYAKLVQKGIKKLEEVPENLRAEVEACIAQA